MGLDDDDAVYVVQRYLFYIWLNDHIYLCKCFSKAGLNEPEIDSITFQNINLKLEAGFPFNSIETL